MTTQYYDGNQFITNNFDSCTAFDGDNSDNYSFSLNGLNTPLAGINLNTISGAGSFSSGFSKLLITKPSDASKGQIRLTYDNTPPWLQYDWNWDGVAPKVFDDNPSAIATFGIFRGNDRIIYQREIQQ